MIPLGTPYVMEDMLITVCFKVKCDAAELKKQIFAVEVLLLQSKFVIIQKYFKNYFKVKAFDWSVFRKSPGSVCCRAL